MEFSEDASAQIFSRQATFLAAIDKVDSMIRKRIEDHYADMLTVNQALTEHIRSAAKVTATREELFKKLRLDYRQLIPMDRVNEQLEKLMSQALNKGEVGTVINEIKSTIEGNKSPSIIGRTCTNGAKNRVFWGWSKFVNACVERDKEIFGFLVFCYYPPALLIVFSGPFG